MDNLSKHILIQWYLSTLITFAGLGIYVLNREPSFLVTGMTVSVGYLIGTLIYISRHLRSKRLIDRALVKWINDPTPITWHIDKGKIRGVKLTDWPDHE